MARLRADRVSLAYGDATVVHDLSLVVPDGAITTIVGPNGSGKSTMLRGLGRLLRPHGGSVVLDGELIHRLPTKEVARRLGLLHQQPDAPDGVTVEDLARRGRYPHQGFLQPPAQRDVDAVEAALFSAGMESLRHRPVDTLSGGQRQRAWIAMALAQETDLLLLDEPTTFLDLAHQLEVIELVRDLQRDGKTIVMVLHDVNEAARASHRIVAMKDGRVLREGSPRDVLEPGTLFDLYGVRCDVSADPRRGSPVCIPASAVEDDLDRQPGDLEPTDGDAPLGVEVRDLSTGYAATDPVSRDLSIDLPAGRITAIVGPNACGKSTLLRTGGRLLKPLGGSISLGGHDVARGSRRALARRLAMVMQGPAPPAGFLVEDVVAAGRMPHQGFLRQWTRADARTVAAALDRCGLIVMRYRPIETLSGGERQRVWLAMALAQDAPFLFLDEPTTFLDLGYQIEMLDLIHRLNRDEGRTVVLVLHDLNLAARYADLLVAMKDGAVVAQGHPSEIVDTGLVRRVFSIESEVVRDPRTGRPLVVPLDLVRATIRAGSPGPTASEPGTALAGRPPM